MAQDESEDLVDTIEGPSGTAEIFEVTLPSSLLTEVEYKVVFGGQETRFPSRGEAHLLTNQLAGVEETP